MSVSVLSEAPLFSVGLPSVALRERFIIGYRWMLLARRLEEKIGSLYQSGKIVGGVYLGKGQEALSGALGQSLQRGKDVFAPLIRDMAGRLAFGEELIDPARTYLGSVLGPMKGRDGNIHRGRPRNGMPAMISHLGAMVSVVCGMLMAKRFRGETDAVGATCLGDGATSTGAFHEALNMAAVEKLPLVVCVANNQFAYSTSNDRQFACEDLVDRAKGYGVMGHSVDGTDLEACLTVMERAIALARHGAGPQLVVGSMLRLTGHGAHDDASYVPDAIKQTPLGRDCLELAKDRLLKEAWATVADLESWDQHMVDQVQQAVAQAQKEGAPNPYDEDWQAMSMPIG